MSLKIKNPKYHDLPSEYTELEFIYSSGSNYFDIGIAPNNITKINVKGNLEARNTAFCGCGSSQSADDRFLVCSSPSSTGLACRLAETINFENTYNYTDTNEIEVDITNSTMTINGDATVTISHSGSLTSQTIYLFGANYNPVSLTAKGSIYYFKAYNGDTLVRNMIPAKRISDGVLGFYDLCGSTYSETNTPFYTKVGSGTLSTAGDVNIAGEIHELYKKNPASHNLPSGYTELEYIENTSADCWFDTGVNPITEKTVVEIKGYVNNSNSAFGGDGNSNPKFNSTSITAASIPFRYGQGNYYAAGSTGAFYNIPATIKFGNNKMYLDGELKNTLSEASFTYSTYSLKIWSRTSGSTDMATGRIYFANVYEEDDIEFQGIPAIEESTSKVGLYDLVSDAFIPNSGSGAFIAGPEVSQIDYIEELYKKNSECHNLPSGYTELEYIQSDGTQYIDTGMQASTANGTKITVDFKYDVTPTGITAVFGRYGGTNGRFNFGWLTSSSVANTFAFDFANINARTSTTFDTERHTASLWADYHCYIDGEDVTVYSSHNDVSDMAGTIWLFKANNNGSGMTGKVYSFKVEDSTGTLQNLIPAKNSSGIVGMYDTVGGNFYSSATSTAFIAGPEVEPYNHIFSAGYDTTITNTSNISMPNARAKSLAYSVSGNSKRTITIDDTEYDIPDGYTLLDYIESTGTQYIDFTNQTTISTPITKLEQRIKVAISTTSSARQFVCSTGEANTGHYVECGTDGTWGLGSGQTGTGVSVVAGQIYELKHIMNGGTNSELYVDGTLSRTITQYQSSSVIEPRTLFCLISASQYQGEYVRIYNYRLYNDDVLVTAFVPMKDSGNVIGMYDFVTNTFFTNAGTGTFTAGNELPTPDNNLGVISVGDKTENIYDGTITHWAYTSTYVTSNSNYRGITVPVEEGVTYTFKRFSLPETASSNRFVYYFTTEYPYDRLTVYNVTSSTPTTSLDVTFTVPSGMKYVVFYFDVLGHDISGTQMMIVEGSTVPSTYIPYGYKIPLIHANNCGMIVYDGSDDEPWALSGWAHTTYNPFYVNNFPSTCAISLCYVKDYPSTSYTTTEPSIPSWTKNSATTFLVWAESEYDTLEKWKAHLAQKPLVVYYKRNDDTSWTAPTAYTIYDDNPLYKVGTYTDNINSNGVRTNNIGIKVLDGTETWNYDSAHSRFHMILSDALSVSSARTCVGKCSHYNIIDDGRAISSVSIGDAYICPYNAGELPSFICHDSHTSVSDFTTWLAAQYSAGTPVIVYYPLATPTTETITAPSINTAKGDNYLECITDVSPSSISGTYRLRNK